MSTDWREKEREFLAGLEADTGRDLAGWMALISAQSLSHRNDIIDWLRQRGFRFSRASWLERIHHNGGQPIYLDASAIRPRGAAIAAGAAVTIDADKAATPVAAHVAAPAATPVPAPLTAAPTPTVEPPAVEPPAAAPQQPAEVVPPQAVEPPLRRALTAAAPPRPAPSSQDAIAETLSRAKAYRPLALHLLRGIEAALPGLVLAAGASHVVLARPAAFALVAVSGKDIRLALNLGEREIAAPFEPVRLPVASARAAGPLTHMIVLTDARQIDGALIARVVEAAAQADT